MTVRIQRASCSPRAGLVCMRSSAAVRSRTATAGCNRATVLDTVVWSDTLRHRSTSARSSATSACDSNVASESALGGAPLPSPKASATALSVAVMASAAVDDAILVLAPAVALTRSPRVLPPPGASGCSPSSAAPPPLMSASPPPIPARSLPGADADAPLRLAAPAPLALPMLLRAAAPPPPPPAPTALSGTEPIITAGASLLLGIVSSEKKQIF
mmetsp:Transcript_35085/g.86022  ORF Transcript_35085/g.86022 Transcript_35085/m.86022 type:complete len:215 (-) Transcript_35085:184-828(-)